MSMVIANNMSAVNTKRQFGTSARGMGGAMEKLSSGYKINTGKDDPAGIVISEKLRSQLNGLKRAQQNTEEAINVMGIAEGALNEMNAILKKMKALAIHSNNTGVTSPDQIAADQAEMDSAVQTLDRIAQTTKFSQENLLNGAKDIAYETTTSVKGTQQNSLLNTRDTSFKQIFKRDDYAVAISFTGSANADEVTGIGEVDFTKQAAKAYLEVDTSKDPQNTAQIQDGKFTQDQAFTLTGTKGSRAFTFGKGETVATMVNQIKSVADSTGIDAALVFNSDQKIDFTMNANGATVVDAATTFKIAGMNDTSGAAVNFTLKPTTAVKTAMGAAGLSFTATVDETLGEVVLSVGGTAVTTGWDGAADTLKAALELTVSSNGAGKATATTLLADDALTVSGDIDQANSVSAKNYTFTAIPKADVGTITVNNVFGTAAEGGGNVNGTLVVNVGNLTAAGLPLQDVYNGLSTEMKASFVEDVEAGNIFINAALVGDQGKMQVELSIVGGAVGSTQTTYATQRQDIAPGANLGNSGGTSSTATFAGGIFAGVTAQLTNLDKSAMGGWVDNTPINVSGNKQITLANANYAGAPKTTLGTLETNGTAFKIETSGGGFAAPTVGDIGNYKANSTDATTATIANNGYVAGGALDNVEFKMAIQQNAGDDPNSATYSVFMINQAGGAKYLLTDNWSGAAGALSVDEVTTMGPTAGDPAIADALSKLTYTMTAVNRAETGAAAIPAAGDPSARLTLQGGAAMVISDGLYNYGNKVAAANGAADIGKVELKIENLDLSKLITANALDADQQAKLIEALNSGRAKLTATTLDQGAGEWGIGINISYVDYGGDGALGGGDDVDTVVALMEINEDDITAVRALDANGQTVDADGASGAAGGWLTLGTADAGLEGIKIRITNSVDTTGAGYQGSGALEANGTGKLLDPTFTTANVAGAATVVNGFGQAGAAAQVGGMDANATTAARQAGSVAVFNNEVNVTDAKTGKTNGVVSKGISSLAISDAAKDGIQLGMNTDGQGRVFVKFIDDGSYELYKDESMSEESLVGTGINGQASTQSNNSGLAGITVHMTGTELTKVKGVYFTVAGIEGKSTVSGSDGVSYNGDVVGTAGTAVFDADKTLMTGVELGKNTDADGRIYLETIYDDTNKTVQVNAYKDRNKRPQDLVAQSELMDVSTFAGKNPTGAPNTPGGSATFVLNEKRNADGTQGTGLGIVLATDNAIFGKLLEDGQSVNLNTTVEFKNLGARIFAQDYGSANFIKATQDKGSIFHYYASAGENDSKRMIDATAGGVTVQVNGQDATLSINGTQVKTNGLELSMATQDIQADLVFNQGKVGSTTMAQVGYETASIFTKVGALNLGSVDKEVGGKYDGLSGLLANAGHVTNERVDNFQGGMQLQLGEGAGDQNRTVVAIKSMTSENLGRVTKSGYWDGDAVYSQKTFTMKDIFGGGAASLKQSPTLAMEIIEQAIGDVSELRAQIGAVQTNLLQTNSNNLAVTMENIQKTESGIRDADMADEMTEFTKNQVLQSAAMSMMSQANQSSQNVLQLLR